MNPVPYHRGFIEEGGKKKSQQTFILTNQIRPNKNTRRQSQLQQLIFRQHLNKEIYY